MPEVLSGFSPHRSPWKVDGGRTHRAPQGLNIRGFTAPGVNTVWTPTATASATCGIHATRFRPQQS